MSSGNYTGPRVPGRPAPPPPTANNAQSIDSSQQQNNRRGGLSISKLLPNIIKKSSNDTAVRRPSTKKAPPPRPPPPKLPPKKQVVDLLSGSPPSSPSPTLKSQESGFEEDPDIWRSWSDSSRSTPLMDWQSETLSPVWEWPAEPADQSKTANSSRQQPAPSAAAGLVHSSSMPTIIRSAPRKLAKPEYEMEKEDHSPPMPTYPPPPPPPFLSDDSSSAAAAPTWKAVAMYDYNSTHLEDLVFKEGDEIEIVSQVDDNWLQGKLGDKTGTFPACFVNIIN